MSIVGLLVALILIGLLFWAVRSLVAAFSIPQPIAGVVYVVLVILVVLGLLQAFGLVSLPGGPVLRLR